MWYEADHTIYGSKNRKYALLNIFKKAVTSVSHESDDMYIDMYVHIINTNKY